MFDRKHACCLYACGTIREIACVDYKYKKIIEQLRKCYENTTLATESEVVRND